MASAVFEGLKVDSVAIMIINAGSPRNGTTLTGSQGQPHGFSQGQLTTYVQEQPCGQQRSYTKRLGIIKNILQMEKPHIVLFQEMGIKENKARTWIKEIHKDYTYHGGKDVGVAYNSKYLVSEQLDSDKLKVSLKRLQENDENGLRERFPVDFTPFDRMYASKMTFRHESATSSLQNNEENTEFICISWHGPRVTQCQKMLYCKYLVELCCQIKRDYKMPLLIGGDFNMNINKVNETLEKVKSPFETCNFGGQCIRAGLPVIDFCMICDDLQIDNKKCVDVKEFCGGETPIDVFDHDPLFGELRLRQKNVGNTVKESGKDFSSMMIPEKEFCKERSETELQTIVIIHSDEEGISSTNSNTDSENNKKVQKVRAEKNKREEEETGQEQIKKENESGLNQKKKVETESKADTEEEEAISLELDMIRKEADEKKTRKKNLVSMKTETVIIEKDGFIYESTNITKKFKAC